MCLGLDRNAMQTRSLDNARRLEIELPLRLQLLNGQQLKVLTKGSSDERIAITLLALLRRIHLLVELTCAYLLENRNESIHCSDAL